MVKEFCYCVQYTPIDSLSLWVNNVKLKDHDWWEVCNLCGICVSGKYKLNDGCSVVFRGQHKEKDGFKWAVGADFKKNNCKVAVDNDINLSASKSRKFGDRVNVTKWISFSLDDALHNLAAYEDWLKVGAKVTVDG